MADIRNTVSGSSLVPQARTPASSDAVRAAQRAFFQAALNGVEPIATPQPRGSPTASVQPTRSDPPPPGRLLRPGSLLDIKV